MIDQNTLQGWTAAAKSTQRQAHIHPAGVDPAAYEASGKADAERVLGYCKKGQTVLDYGCGDGRVMKHMTGVKILGVDAIKEMAELAGGCTPEDFDKKVDVIYSISVFIHNSHKAGRQIIQWMAEHLKPGGLLLLQLPIYDQAKEPADWTDVGVWTMEQLIEAAAENDLTIVETATNLGAFSFRNIGPKHHLFQVLHKRKKQ